MHARRPHEAIPPTVKRARQALAKRERPAKHRQANAATVQPTEVTAQPPPVAMASVPMTVRWGDLDAFNHVNNAAFLVYAQEARLAWLASVKGTWFDETMMPVIAAAKINFRRQLAWPAQIVVELTAGRIGASSLTIAHRIVDAGDHGRVYADGDVVMVWVEPDSGRPVTLPAAIRAACQLPSPGSGLPESAATTSK